MRRGNGQEGFVPANYIKEIEPHIVTRNRSVVVKVPEKVKVKKTGIRKEVVRKKSSRKASDKSPEKSNQLEVGKGKKARRTPSRKFIYDLYHIDIIAICLCF